MFRISLSLSLSLFNLSSFNLNIIPKQNTIFKYTLNEGDIITFKNPTTENFISFRLYLIMPSSVVSFTLPQNIIWENEPDFTTENALYMLVFEWNPIINKWLGNLMWEPITIPTILYYNMQVSVNKDFIYDDVQTTYNLYVNSPKILTYNPNSAGSFEWGTSKTGIQANQGSSTYEYGANFYIDDVTEFRITESGALPIPNQISIEHNGIIFTFTPIPVYSE